MSAEGEGGRSRAPSLFVMASHGFYSILGKRKLVPRSAIYLCHKIISNLQQREQRQQHGQQQQRQQR